MTESPVLAAAVAAPQVERTNTGVLVVTSETLANGAGVQHKNVLELISTHKARLERFGQVAFETRPGYNNAQVRIALLNEQHATLMMTFMRNTEKVLDFKVSLVDAFYTMAQQMPAPPAPQSLSRMEILQMAMASEQENQQLKALAAANAPKVDYVDTFVADNDTLLFRTVASDLFVGEQLLREALRLGKWVYRQEQTRRNSQGQVVSEYQWSEYADKKKYFHRHVNHQAPLFKGSLAHTLKITPEGAVAIKRFVAKAQELHGTLKHAVQLMQERESGAVPPEERVTW